MFPLWSLQLHETVGAGPQALVACSKTIMYAKKKKAKANRGGERRGRGRGADWLQVMVGCAALMVTAKEQGCDVAPEPLPPSLSVAVHVTSVTPNGKEPCTCE